MFGSICLLFADDAVFLTSLEFALEPFGSYIHFKCITLSPKVYHVGKKLCGPTHRLCEHQKVQVVASI